MSENRPQMTVQSAVEVVAAVVDVEQGEKVLRIYREEQAHGNDGPARYR